MVADRSPGDVRCRHSPHTTKSWSLCMQSSHRAVRMNSVKIVSPQFMLPPSASQLFNAFRQIMFRTHIEPRRSHPVTTFRIRTLSAQCQSPIVCSCSQKLSHSLSHQDTGGMMHAAHNATSKCEARCPTRFFSQCSVADYSQQKKMVRQALTTMVQSHSNLLKLCCGGSLP